MAAILLKYYSFIVCLEIIVKIVKITNLFSRQDDDNDMYEAPPCERPAVKVPPRAVEENVYLGNI